MKEEILWIWAAQNNKRKGTYPQCLLPCSVSVCSNQDNLRAFTVERTHKTTEQTRNTWAQPTCHTCVTFADAVTVTNKTQEMPLKILACWLRAAQHKHKHLSELIKETMGNHCEALPQTEAFDKYKYQSAVCLPLSCYNLVLGLWMLSYSKGSSVSGRLLKGAFNLNSTALSLWKQRSQKKQRVTPYRPQFPATKAQFLQYQCVVLQGSWKKDLRKCSMV